MKRKAAAITLAVMFLPWSAVFLLRSLGPVEYAPLGLATSSLLLGFLSAFLFVVAIWWLLQSARTGHLRQPDHIPSLLQERLIKTMLWLSIVYFLAIVLDKIVLGSVGEVGVTEARYLAMEEGLRGTLLGAVHHYLAGAPVLLACLLIAFHPPGRMKRGLLWVVVALCFSSFFLTGGRNSFAIGAAFVFLFWFLHGRRIGSVAKPSSKGPSRRLPISIVMGIAIGAVYSLYLFTERAEIRGGDLQDAAARLWLDHGAQIGAPESSGELAEASYLAWAFATYYATHSLGYLDAYLEADYSPMTLGGFSFLLFARTIDVLFGTSHFSGSLESLLTQGAYLSLPGSAYVDFGIPGTVLVGALLGLLSVVYISRSLSDGHITDKLVGAFFMTILVFSPLYSITGVANGPSILVLVILAKLLNKRFVFARKRHQETLGATPG